ncbi:hypothetical protein QBC34DRAFT_224233 [Podospora aff. communis PSN243]|uniref:2EXR domain-containing protein n=1 Tax=Podospora aff. communis PSN243 TaxID=3040156 RepID=A0AAV9G5N7_9PEZI|nr:hypothetical protein QBC34DRAFT_224233 [Podospora aff. communis PSN243]
MDTPVSRETTALGAKFGELHIGIKSAPDSPDPTALRSPTALTVTVTSLPTPPFSPSAAVETAPPFTLDHPTPDPETTLPEPLFPSPPQPLDTFPLFPLLPAELRLKIWSLSFLPRAIELHAQRTHYADSDRYTGTSGTPRWQSQSRNPAALSVNAEARSAALEFYTIALPLCAPRNEHPGNTRDGDRLLYLNPEEDTVVLLGDLNYGRLTTLLEWFRKQDAAYYSGRRSGRSQGKGKGVRRLAMSVAPWSHMVGAATLKAFARTVFADVEEFVLFIYKEPVPPDGWGGGRVVLEEATAEEDDAYRRYFVFGRGKQFREGDGWISVGKRPLKIADIQFLEGW